jgi:hypothetical protein
VFIRHAFCTGRDALYIADKNIENTNFPPFITIVRGMYECVWAIRKKQDNKFRVIGDNSRDHKGYLNENQNSNLVLNYLQGYKNLSTFIEKNRERVSQYVLFDFNWDITKSKQNEKENELRGRKKKDRFRKKEDEKTGHIPSQLKEEDDANYQKFRTTKEKWQVQPIPKEESTTKSVKFTPIQETRRKSSEVMGNAIDQHSSRMLDVELERKKMRAEQVKAEVDPYQLNRERLQTTKDVKIAFDKKGLVIIPNSYLKTRYQLVPTKSYESVYWNQPGTHPLPES